MKHKSEVLLHMGVPESSLEYPLAGAIYLEEMGGPLVDSFWRDENPGIVEKQRDEFFLVATCNLCIANLMRKVAHRHHWRLSFDVAYLFQTKSLAQSIRSIDLLCRSRCYADAFAIVRSVHCRTNLLLLFSLGPFLFDDWLRHPKHEKYLDRHVRDELAKHGIHAYPHLYDQFSELVHGQFQALVEAGHFEQGLYPEVPAVANMVYVGSKFLMGLTGWAGLSMVIQDQGPASGWGEELTGLEELFRAIVETILAPNRIDHLWTMIAEDRHWEKAGKDQMVIGKWFDFDNYRQQLSLFHRNNQPKTLGKKYRNASA